MDVNELYEDLEVEVTEKPITTGLVTRLRNRAKDTNGKRYGLYPSHVDMLLRQQMRLSDYRRLSVATNR